MLQTGISVLVLYENFAIAAAAAQRLLDMPMVHMVRAEHAGACDGDYDVVVMCPYLRERRRAEVLRRWAGAQPRASVIELEDIAGAPGARLFAGATESVPAHSVLRALGLDAALV